MTIKQKKLIPNALTVMRIILTIIIIFLGLTNHIKLVILLTIIAAITDFLDGKLARAWNVVSLTGAKLDAIADKFFAIGLIACLTNKLKLLYIPLVIEIILSGANLYFHFKSGKTKSLTIGKIKTWILFTTIIFVIISTLLKNNIISSITNGFIYITINLQILSLINYTLYYKKNKDNLSLENNEEHKKIIENTDNTIVVDNLNELIDEVLNEEKPKHEFKDSSNSEIDEILNKYTDNNIDDIL